jgi:hypothetical protein
VDPNNRSADRSNCSSDHRQQVNVSGVITAPRVDGRILGLFANGWQLSPVYHWGTGLLTTATYGTDVALTAAGNQRAQQISSNVYGDGSSVNYLNINAFLAPGAAPKGIYGTTRPLTNSVMFGAPTAALNSSTFGHLTPQIQNSAPGTATTARIMQFAFKYVF